MLLIVRLSVINFRLNIKIAFVTRQSKWKQKMYNENAIKLPLMNPLFEFFGALLNESNRHTDSIMRFWILLPPLEAKQMIKEADKTHVRRIQLTNKKIWWKKASTRVPSVWASRRRSVMTPLADMCSHICGRKYRRSKCVTIRTSHVTCAVWWRMIVFFFFGKLPLIVRIIRNGPGPVMIIGSDARTR